MKTEIKIPKRLLTTEEAGHYLGNLSAWTICDMIRKGVLPYVPAGKKKLLDIRDLDKWIDSEKTLHIC